MDSDTRDGKTPSSRRPKKVPRRSLKEAEELAELLWKGAGDGWIARAAFADHLHQSASSSTFDNRVALLSAYGLIDQEGDRVRLTPTGLGAIRSDKPEEQARARRAAFLFPRAFQQLTTSFQNSPVPDPETLAVNLRFDFILDPKVARACADAFIESASHAGVLTQDRRISADGKASAKPAEPGIGPATNLPREGDHAAESLDESPHESNSFEPQTEPRPQTSRPIANPTTNSQLNVSLDLSGFAPDEILTILTALGFIDGSG